MIKTSFVITCFNSQNHISRCLDSVLAQSDQDFEILLADDGSTDHSQEILQSYQNDTRIKIFSFKENRGPAKTRNWLAQKAAGFLLFFLDIDTKMEMDCLSLASRRLLSNQDLGGLQTALLKEDGSSETAGHFLGPFGFPYEVSSFPEESLIFGARTAGLILKKDVFDQIQGFDEDYLIYGEDTDLCWRVWLAGKQIIFFPSARVWHFQKSSFSPKTRFRLFYEGAKTGPANILKNAAPSMILWLLPLNLLAWLGLALKLLLQGRLSDSGWIIKGLFWNLANLKKTLAKRKKWPGHPELDKIIFGPLSFLEIFKKGLSWSKNV